MHCIKTNLFSDEESDMIYTTWLHEEDDDSAEDSSDIKKALHKPRKIKRDTTTKPTVRLASANVSMRSTIDMIDTFDRPADAKAEGTYARSGTYAISPEDEPGKRIPKAGAFAEAGIGRACAEYRVFEAEAKGPNASAGAEASLVGVGAMARAELASVSAKAGPVSAKLGLGVDTGASIGLDGLEAKILGTGISIGPKTSISLLGSELSCSVM